MVAPNPIRVLCVDDNRFVAEAIELKLKSEGGFEWCGRLAGAERLVDEASRIRPDVVLLDIDMPGKDAFESLAELAAAHPEVRTVMLSGHVRRELIDRSLEAGAWGYVSKNDGVASIVAAIRQVAKGEVALGPDVAAEHGRG